MLYTNDKAVKFKRDNDNIYGYFRILSIKTLENGLGRNFAGLKNQFS